MAQTGFTPISLYYTTTASAAPTAGNLVAGELAINTNDGVLYYKDSSGVVQSIASKAGNSGSFTNLAYTGTLTGGTGIVNLGSGQFYKDASGNIGVGSTSISGWNGKTLQIASATNDAGIKITGDLGSWGIGGCGTASGSNALRFYNFTTSVEAMRIDSSNNVGIGTSSPSGRLDVANTTTPYLNITALSGSSAAVLCLNATSGGQEAITYQQALRFGTATGVNATGFTERMRIDSSGNLLVGKTSATANGGDVQVSKGITFPSTQSAQSNANTLDDYEEGTFTPTVTAASGSNGGITTSGVYTKVGRLVYVSINIDTVTKGTLSGQINVGNLPFSVSSNNTTGTFRWDLGGGIPALGTTIICPQSGGGTALELQMFSGSGYLGNLAASNLGATFSFYNITYIYNTST